MSHSIGKFKPVSLLSQILIVCGILYSCSPKESSDLTNYLRFDNGRAGFIKPAGGCIDDPFTRYLKSVNPNIIFALRTDSVNDPWSIITVSKYVTDTVTPMEIAFIEETVKYPSEKMAWKWRLADFGVYDKNGKRYRYKISFVDNEDNRSSFNEMNENEDSLSLSDDESKFQFKIMYYFMKNDLDSVMYGASIATDTTGYFRSDSILTKVAESFRFFK